jgi:hypothetical protein
METKANRIVKDFFCCSDIKMNKFVLLLVIGVCVFIGILTKVHKNIKAIDMVFRPPEVEVKKSGVAGRGVYALRDFTKGEIIETAPSLIDDCKNFQGVLKDYISGTRVKDQCAINMGYFNYYNHSDKNNAKYNTDYDTQSISVMALKDIKKGEEIFVNYGEKYWTTRDYVNKK